MFMSYCNSLQQALASFNQIHNTSRAEQQSRKFKVVTITQL